MMATEPTQPKFGQVNVFAPFTKRLLRSKLRILILIGNNFLIYFTILGFEGSWD